MTTQNPYTIKIGGNPVTVIPGSLKIDLSLGKKTQGAFNVHTDTNTFFQQYQQVSVLDGGSNLIFSGYLNPPQGTKPGFQKSLNWTLTAMGQEFLAKKRVYAAIWANKTCGFVAQDIFNTILSAEGATRGTIYDGLTPSLTLYPALTLYPGGNVGLIPQFIAYYGKASDALDALVKEASSSGVPYYWTIDWNKIFTFAPYGTVTGPNIDDTMIEQKVEQHQMIIGNPNYRNTQYVTGGVAQTGTLTNTRQGDSKTRTFTMDYAMASAPTITVNGTSKTVGLKGTSGSNYYWAQNDPVITQDTGQTILVSTDTLSVTYIGQYPNTAIVSNGAQITAQAALDGTTGIIEEVFDDKTINSAANAITEGSNLLTRYAQPGMQVQFYTKQSGFAPGQLCFANMPYFNIINQYLMIETVTIDDHDLINIWYQITAILGPYDTNWVSFFSALLMKPPPANTINVGSSSQTSIATSFTATLTLTAILTTTVLTSLFPSTSLHPNTTLFPAG